MKSPSKNSAPVGSAAVDSSSSPKDWGSVLNSKMSEWLAEGMSAPEIMAAEERLRLEWARSVNWPAMPASLERPEEGA